MVGNILQQYEQDGLVWCIHFVDNCLLGMDSVYKPFNKNL